MAVNIYEALDALSARVAAVEGLLKPKPRAVPVTYFFPGPKWDAVFAAKPYLVQINPGSGPGTTASATYAAHVVKLKAAGIKVIGYVHTKYGARPLAEVTTDIDRHFAWYGVDGIFVDTVSKDPIYTNYYTSVSAAIRARGGIVVFNPGTTTIEAHAALADHIMCAETDAATYMAQPPRPAWEAKYPAAKFWHCVHSCPAAQMPTVVDTARARNAGLIYVTDDVMANPYDTLPSYWLDLNAKVASL